MKRLSLLIKPASSICNMRCRYCFYHDISAARDNPSYGIMSRETTDKIISSTFKCLEDGDEIHFAFQGGEPSIAGLPWFKYFAQNVASQKETVKVSWSFQTNGIIPDESWCDFFKENNFLLGLSIDAGMRFHDHNRITAGGDGTYETCMRTKELFDKKQVEYNILCVLTNELAREPEKVWRFILNENIRFIQFIPCMEPPDQAPATAGIKNRNALRPALFAKFYTRLLPLWIRELEAGNYISIKLFDDVANYFFRGIPTSCGIDGRCHNQYVVEADGSTYPCDFYCFDEYKIGNLGESTIRELFDSEKVKAFLNERPQLPPICGSCNYIKACRGGCKRMRNVMYAGQGEVVCGFRSFLEKCLEPLELTVRKVFSKD